MEGKPLSKQELRRRIFQIGEYLKPTKGIRVPEKVRKELIEKQEKYGILLNQS